MLLSALVLASTASAAIFTGRPANATVGVGGETFRLSWLDDGKAPSLTEIGETEIELCIGSRATHECPQVAGTVNIGAQKDLNFTIDANIGEDGQYYFFKYTGANFVGYSTRFFLKNMKGDFTESQEALVKNLTVAAMPSETGSLAGAAAHSSANVVPTLASASAKPSEAAAKQESAAGKVGASIAAAVLAAVAGAGATLL